MFLIKPMVVTLEFLGSTGWLMSVFAVAKVFIRVVATVIVAIACIL